MSGNFIFRNHVGPSVKLYSSKKESFPIPLWYIDVSRTTHTNLDFKQEKRIDDYWNVDGSRDLTDPWTGVIQFTLLEEKPPNEYLHLDNARKLRRIYFIDLEDKEFKETIKNTRKKLETSVAPAMPCKIIKSKKIVGVVHPLKSRQNWRVFWKLVNLQDCVWENHRRIIMKTILQEKEIIHCNIIIWFTNLSLCFKPWKFSQQRQQWTRNGKNWRIFRRGTWRKSAIRKRWSMKQGRKAQKSISSHWWTYVIWKVLNWMQSTKNFKVELYSEKMLQKTIQGLMQYSPNKDHQHHKWQQQKSWMAREMGSPRHVHNRRRRTRKGPEPCVCAIT